MRNVFAGFAVIILAACCSCSRKTVTTKVDTVFVKVHDSSGVDPISDKAQDSSDAVVHEIFKYIEKKCPNLKPEIPKLEKKTKSATTLQAKTGGALIAISKKFGITARFNFNGNSGSAIFMGKIPIVVKKTTIIPPKWKQALNVWPIWAIPWLILLLILFFKLK